MERIFSLHYAFMYRSGTQFKLPRRLPMSQVSLVDDHTLHQPCVHSLSFKPKYHYGCHRTGHPFCGLQSPSPRESSSISPEVESLPVTFRCTHAHTQLCLLYDLLNYEFSINFVCRHEKDTGKDFPYRGRRV